MSIDLKVIGILSEERRLCAVVPLRKLEKVKLILIRELEDSPKMYLKDSSNEEPPREI